MVKYLSYNGDLVKSEQFGFSVNNRSFCYGDGFFETIRCCNSKPLFLENHYERAIRALNALKFDIPDFFSKRYFEQNIIRLLKINRIYKGARIRLAIFRKEGGFYTPQSNQPEFIINAAPLEPDIYKLNEKGLKVEIFDDLLKTRNVLSSFKTSSSLMFVLAGLWRKENKYEDCFILNDSGKIIEALASNIFLCKGDVLFTPSLKSGCVDGTMRKKIIEIALSKGLIVKEPEGFTEKSMFDADEVFVTNAIQGINWVGAFRDKRYYHVHSSMLIEQLNKMIK